MAQWSEITINAVAGELGLENNPNRIVAAPKHVKPCDVIGHYANLLSAGKKGKERA